MVAKHHSEAMFFFDAGAFKLCFAEHSKFMFFVVKLSSNYSPAWLLMKKAGPFAAEQPADVPCIILLQVVRCALAASDKARGNSKRLV